MSIASSPLPIVIFTGTSVSSFSPWLITWTENDVSWPRRTEAEPPSVSCCPPSETVPSPVPCRPGEASSLERSLLPPSSALQQLGDLVGDQPRAVREEAALGQLDLVDDLLLAQHGVHVGPHAGGEDDVAGQEEAHLVGQALDALLLLLARERGGEDVDHLPDAVAAELERLDQVVVRGLQVIGGVHVVARSLHQLVCLGAQALEAVLAVDVADASTGVRQRVEHLLRLRARLVDDRAHVAHVVLEPAFLARPQTTPQEQEKEDGEDDRADDRDRAAGAQGLGVNPRPGGASSGGRPALGRVRVVEKGQGVLLAEGDACHANGASMTGPPVVISRAPAGSAFPGPKSEAG